MTVFSMGSSLQGAHTIVLGNEKGGSGKSTTAMHVIVALMELGFSVGAVDLDARQRTLSRYIENRNAHIAKTGARLSMPEHAIIARTSLRSMEAAEADERQRLFEVLARMKASLDFVVVDCPGSDSYLSRQAHARADTLVTPMNDSFVDLDLLAKVDPGTHQVIGPSHYSAMVWESRKDHAAGGGAAIDWVVLRNRLASLEARNQRRVDTVLSALSKRIGFRYVAGFGERVIYRELFLKGLTLMDLKDGKAGALTISHVSARQEVRNLIQNLRLPGIAREAAVG
jgi:chromosome partitioning protein